LSTRGVRHFALPDGGRVETTMELDLPLDRVFAFFGAAENLGAITPPELGFRIETPAPIAMRPGVEIDYSLRLWGIPLRWRSLISRWEPPTLFVDEQVRGPYRRWVHTHRFTALGPQRTRIEDHVEYALPWPPLGLVARPAVSWQLRRIFQYRQRRVLELLGTGERLPLSGVSSDQPARGY
jgi:ligand-binding SRPBCC domain-containing protein